MQSTQPRSSHLAQRFWPLHPQSVVLVLCWPWLRRVPPVGRSDSRRCRCPRGWRGCGRPGSPRDGCNRWPSHASASARDGSHQSRGTLWVKGFPAWHGGVGGLRCMFCFVEGMCFENKRIMNEWKARHEFYDDHLESMFIEKSGMSMFLMWEVKHQDLTRQDASNINTDGLQPAYFQWLKTQMPALATRTSKDLAQLKRLH